MTRGRGYDPTTPAEGRAGDSTRPIAARQQRQVDDLAAALAGQHVIIEPNSPSHGVMVASIEVNGAPVELMEIDHQARPDL